MKMNTRDKIEIRQLIVDSLSQLNYDKVICNKPEAIELMLGTWAQESDGGLYTHQLKDGPAHGLWQIEKYTFFDIVLRCRKYHYEVMRRNIGLYDLHTDEAFELLITNHSFCCQAARIKYFLCPGSIPLTIQGQAEYYKKYYNTQFGVATIEEYIEKYNRYVL